MDSKLILIPVPMDELLKQLREVIRAEIHTKQEQDSNAKLLAPSEVCKMFSPAISTVTLRAWTRDGKLQEHRIGGRVYYIKNEVIGALQTLKKYRKTL